MSKKSNPSMVRPGFGLSVFLAGAACGLVACSDSGDAADGATNTTATSSVTMTSGDTSGTSGTMGSATTGNTVTTVTTVSTTSSSTTGSTTGVGATTTGISAGGLGVTGTGTGDTTTTTGGTSAGGMGTTSNGTTTGNMGAGGTGGVPTDEDIDMTGEDFSCIGDWDKVLGFRITNLLGHLEEALAVANNPEGGVYPVGTLIQHLPTEAMVKRRTGFSPETKDWEFFLLTLGQDGTTTIAERGTTAIMTSMGQTCVSCHSMVPDQYDFICNTWGDAGSQNCGFDFMDSFLDQQLATDTRCQ